MPTGTTAQRAGSPAAGDFRYNTTTGRFEGYLGSAWGSFGSSNSFFTNIFAGDGSDTTFTLSQTIDNENDLLVFIDGVFQAQNVYSVSGTTLTFATAPANGRVITVYSVKAGVSGSNYTLSTMTGDGSDTTLTLNTDPVNENNVQVYIDGVYQNKDTFSVSGTTLTFSEAPPNSTKVEAIVATQTTINTATQLLDADGDTKVMVEESADEDKIRFDTAGSERAIIDSTGLGIGTSSPFSKTQITETGWSSGAPYGTVLTVTGNNTNDANWGHLIITDSSTGTGNGGMLRFATGSTSSDISPFAGFDGFTEGANYGGLKFLTRANGGTATERMRIDSSGQVGIGTASPSEKLDVSGKILTTGYVIGNNTALYDDHSTLSAYSDTNGVYLNGKNAGWLSVSGDGTQRTYIRLFGQAYSDERMQFNTANSERMRIDSVGNILIGTTTTNIATEGTVIYGTGNEGVLTLSSTGMTAFYINRSNDGTLVDFRSGNVSQGYISVSGSTVSYVGFTGTHESSGIADNEKIGTVVSTIDQLDVYANTQTSPEGSTEENPKAGQTRANHAKIKISDAEGDKRVYGVLERYDDNNKPIVASVGIGSVLVTGACEGGDLLESNGDGTAKVQDDDIIKSKTIGKVTIGNSDTNVKLVSCVLYCG